MPGRLLKHAPLVEAIFEARWGPPAGTTVDSNYKLFVGRFFDRLLKKYPEPEDLPTASMPEAFVYGQVQQRFRAEKGGWPVVQVGPGVVTVNDTTRYSWEDFRPRCSEVINTVFEAYPKPENLHFIALQLRYIDSIAFDAAKKNVWEFLRDKMQLDVQFPKSLFEDLPVKKHSDFMSFQSAFITEKPKGRVSLSLGFGQRDNAPALLWEIGVTSVADDVCKMPAEFDDWLVAAHQITHDWFDRLIAGELERRFKGE